VSAHPPRVTARIAESVTGTTTVFERAMTVEEAWHLLMGTIGYHIPHNMNTAVANARRLRKVR
jgi:hypothetical protein